MNLQLQQQVFELVLQLATLEKANKLLTEECAALRSQLNEVSN